jgi:hypothetical protein
VYYINLIYISTKEKADEPSKKFEEFQAMLKRITEGLKNTRIHEADRRKKKLDLEGQADELNKDYLTEQSKLYWVIYRSACIYTKRLS